MVQNGTKKNQLDLFRLHLTLNIVSDLPKSIFLKIYVQFFTICAFSFKCIGLLDLNQEIISPPLVVALLINAMTSIKLDILILISIGL